MTLGQVCIYMCSSSYYLCVHNRCNEKVRQHAVHHVKEGPEAYTNGAEPEYVEYGIEQ